MTTRIVTSCDKCGNTKTEKSKWLYAWIDSYAEFHCSPVLPVSESFKPVDLCSTTCAEAMFQRYLNWGDFEENHVSTEEKSQS